MIEQRRTSVSIGTWLSVLILMLAILAVAQDAYATHKKCAGKGVQHGFTGTSGNDQIQGNNNANVMDGLGGRDTLDGAGGSDTACGSGGKDSFWGDSGGDVMLGGDSCDSMNGQSNADVLKGQSGPDTLNVWGGCANAGAAQAGSGYVQGDSGNDDLYGGGSSDFLRGGDGSSDWADGGDGTDRCDLLTTETALSCEIPV